MNKVKEEIVRKLASAFSEDELVPTNQTTE